MKASGTLAEPATPEPGAGVNAAVSSRIDAVNDVWQVVVTLWPRSEIGSFSQPLIGAPASSRVSVPAGGVPAELEVTV